MKGAPALIRIITLTPTTIYPQSELPLKQHKNGEVDSEAQERAFSFNALQNQFIVHIWNRQLITPLINIGWFTSTENLKSFCFGIVTRSSQGPIWAFGGPFLSPDPYGMSEASCELISAKLWKKKTQIIIYPFNPRPVTAIRSFVRSAILWEVVEEDSYTTGLYFTHWCVRVFEIWVSF